MMTWSLEFRRIVRRPWLPVLLILQAALAVGVSANALGVISLQLDRVLSPTGLHEQDLWLLEVRRPAGGAIEFTEAQDLIRALQRLPAVISVSRVNDLPLRNAGWRTAVWPTPELSTQTGTHVGIFLGDQAGREVLGLDVISGRSFTVADLAPVESLGTLPKVTMVSAALAEQLFGGVDVVGRALHTQLVGEIEIIGVVQNLQASWPRWSKRDFTLYMPGDVVGTLGIFAIRVHPEKILDAAVIAENLSKLNVTVLRPYSDIRKEAYAESIYLIVMLSLFTVAVVLVVGTAAYALTSHWVQRRVHEIGVRRALGATSGHLFVLVFAEISLYLVIGCLVGGAIASLNLVGGFVQSDASSVDQWLVFLISSAFVCSVGQLAVWATGRRSFVQPISHAVKVP